MEMKMKMEMKMEMKTRETRCGGFGESGLRDYTYRISRRLFLIQRSHNLFFLRMRAWPLTLLD